MDLNIFYLFVSDPHTLSHICVHVSHYSVISKQLEYLIETLDYLTEYDYFSPPHFMSGDTNFLNVKDGQMWYNGRYVSSCRSQLIFTKIPILLVLRQTKISLANIKDTIVEQLLSYCLQQVRSQLAAVTFVSLYQINLNTVIVCQAWRQCNSQQTRCKDQGSEINIHCVRIIIFLFHSKISLILG